MAALPNGPGVDSKRRKLSSLFSELEMCPPDAIFNVKTKFLADKSPDKVNLGIGGKSLSLQVAESCDLLNRKVA